MAEPHLLDEGECLGELVFGLAGKADDDVGCDVEVGYEATPGRQQAAEFACLAAALGLLAGL